MPSRSLLVVSDILPLRDELDYVFTHLLRQGPNSTDKLDVLLFCDQERDRARQLITERWPGEVSFLSTAEQFAKVDAEVREDMRTFVAGLRARLDAVATAVAGEEGGRRFGELWWYTEVSTRNTPGDSYWWEVFRMAAASQVFVDASETYTALGAVGSKEIIDLLRSFAEKQAVPFAGRSRRSRYRSRGRELLTRIWAAVTLLFAIIAARWKCRERHRELGSNGKEKSAGRLLAYSWYPRVWTRRHEQWQDMYYGEAGRELSNRPTIDLGWALRMYDKTRFVSPVVYWRRLKTVDTAPPQGSFAILEAWGRIFETVRVFARVRDLLLLRRMEKHPDFVDAFHWDRYCVNLASLLVPRLWGAAMVSWPQMELLRCRVRRLTQIVQPQAVLFYCFEFVYGRAIVNGTRDADPLASTLGMQHGPIAPMKLLYAWHSSERKRLSSGAPGLPVPDKYLLDGPIADRIMRESGISEGERNLVGAARFDGVWRTAARLHTRSDSERIRVLVAPGLHDTEFVINLVVGALIDNPQLEIVLKPHPKVSRRFVEEMLRGQTEGQALGRDRAALHIVRDGHIYDWMCRSDLFMATYSSVSVEALGFDLPVILLVPSATPDMSLYKATQFGVLSASDEDQLRVHVQRILTDRGALDHYIDELRPMLQEAFGLPDGRAGDRLVSICESFIASTGRSQRRGRAELNP